MPYADLPPSPTFWRCPACGYEAEFHASGTGSIECGKCHALSAMQQLLAAHAQAHGEGQGAKASSP
jgi:hypothetical protein